MSTTTNLWGRNLYPKGCLSFVRKVVSFSFLSVFSLSASLYAEQPTVLNSTQVILKPESKLWLVGDSTQHEYSSTAKKLNVTVEVDPAPVEKTVYEAIKDGRLKKLDVEIPVNDMTSGKNQLDRNMRKSLKASEHPFIQFHLSNYQVQPSTSDTKQFSIKATGPLEVAGVEKTIDLDGKAIPTADGVQIEGTKELLMTDYGIKPPTMVLLKTDNHVVIHFDLVLGPREEKK